MTRSSPSTHRYLPRPSGSCPWAARSLALAASLAVASFALGGCSSIGDVLSGDKIDYRSGGQKLPGLEVPPDLTQLTRDSRYQQAQGGSVSAAAYQAGSAAAVAPTTVPVVAAAAAGDVQLERAGSERWLRSSQTPEQLWPQIQAFWKDRGFNLTEDLPAAGVMETGWAENRAKLPQDIIRSTLGRVIDSAYSTGEMDKFRTRVERVPGGTEIFITHRGMVEVYTDNRRDQTMWQPRPIDPQLEGELLSRLMLKLGAREDAVAKAIGSQGASTPGASVATARARLVDGQPAATLQIDDGFDRAWRRVGVALDRSGFTVEDRDRTQGVYFVRYVDPALAGREEPNLFQKIFSFGKKTDLDGPAKYRVAVKADGDRSNVTVLNNQGSPENGEAAKRITQMLLDELK